jgi:hypothetical protein
MILLRVFAADDEVAPTAGEGRPIRGTVQQLILVAALGGSVLSVDGKPFQMVLQDEIDHSGNGVRSIARRCAGRHHLEAIKEARRNHIGVEIVGRIDRRGPLAVDKDQGVVRAEAS